jgi:hypothetical protein
MSPAAHHLSLLLIELGLAIMELAVLARLAAAYVQFLAMLGPIWFRLAK